MSSNHIDKNSRSDSARPERPSLPLRERRAGPGAPAPVWNEVERNNFAVLGTVTARQPSPITSQATEVLTSGTTA
jgi:hypothetical protein